MSFLDHVKAVWRKAAAPKDQDMTVVDQVFKYLIGQVNNANKILPYIEEIRLARASSGAKRISLIIQAYFHLETFIASDSSAVRGGQTSPAEIREKIRTDIDIARLPDQFRLIFQPETEQTLIIYKVAVNNLFVYVGTYIGKQRTDEILLRIVEKIDPPIPASQEGMTFDLLKDALQTRPQEQAQAIYRQMYLELFNEIRKSFGAPKALDIAKRDFEYYKVTYSSEFTAKFLGILPDGVLEVERLAFMSREELERKIKERTDDLKDFNEQLEKRVEERTAELEQANKRLEELDKVKTEFISVAAHQLRTPLSAIKWTLSLLLEDDTHTLTSEQKSLLMKGYESNERIINLINKMLVVTRIESGKMQYDFTPILIENLIDAVLLDFTGQAKEREVSIVFARPSEQLPYIEADPDKIRAVIQNLVENALFYTRPKGTITLSAQTHDGVIEVSVQDDGIGIPQEQQAGIFNKFFRADNAVKERTDGSGLGLFVIKNIIETHGGRISFKSVENVGTTFTFTLPVATVNEHPGQ